MTEWLHFHFSLSCIGEGNGNPLQCSCLENPRDGRAWLAAVYGVAQSRTRLKRLSSRSSRLWGMLLFLLCRQLPPLFFGFWHYITWILEAMCTLPQLHILPLLTELTTLTSNWFRVNHSFEISFAMYISQKHIFRNWLAGPNSAV